MSEEERVSVGELNKVLERGLAVLTRLAKGGVPLEEGGKLVLAHRGVLSHVDAGTLATSILGDREPEAESEDGGSLGNRLLKQTQDRLARRRNPLGGGRAP